VGDKITTDHIMPAGPRLKFRSNIDTYSTFVFEGVDPTFASRCAAFRNEGREVFIVAGESYGQGSSREHAAMCPMYLGVKAVFAKSLERIHAANLVNFGIVPLTFSDQEDYNFLETNDNIEITNIIKALKKNQPIVIENKNSDRKISFEYNLSQRQKDIIIAGGLLNYTKKNR